MIHNLPSELYCTPQRISSLLNDTNFWRLVWRLQTTSLAESSQIDTHPYAFGSEDMDIDLYPFYWDIHQGGPQQSVGVVQAPCLPGRAEKGNPSIAPTRLRTQDHQMHGNDILNPRITKKGSKSRRLSQKTIPGEMQVTFRMGPVRKRSRVVGSICKDACLGCWWHKQKVPSLCRLGLQWSPIHKGFSRTSMVFSLLIKRTV